MPACRQRTDPATKQRQNANRDLLVRGIKSRGYASVNDFQLALKRVSKELAASGRGDDREMSVKHREAAEAIREVYCEVYGCDC